METLELLVAKGRRRVVGSLCVCLWRHAEARQIVGRGGMSVWSETHGESSKESDGGVGGGRSLPYTCSLVQDWGFQEPRERLVLEGRAHR